MSMQNTKKNRTAARLGVTLVCAVLAAGLLAGCTGKDNSSSAPADNSSSMSAGQEDESMPEDSSMPEDNSMSDGSSAAQDSSAALESSSAESANA